MEWLLKCADRCHEYHISFLLARCIELLEMTTVFFTKFIINFNKILNLAHYVPEFVATSYLIIL